MRNSIVRAMKFLRVWRRTFLARLRPRGLQLPFPTGPEYISLVATGAKNGRAWVEYKLQAAEWYLLALEEFYARDGDLHRLVGEEMTIDGLLAAGSSAFDAAVAGLIRAIEANRRTLKALQTPAHQLAWSRAKQLSLVTPPISLSCEQSVDAALQGSHTNSPTGWLAQLRQLRNRTTHEDTLARMFYIPQEPCRIKVPGLGEVAPMPYLRAVLPQIRALCEETLREADRLNP